MAKQHLVLYPWFLCCAIFLLREAISISGHGSVLGYSEPSTIQKPTMETKDHRRRKEIFLWKPVNFGLNNQLMCLNAAATLAIQYNRTLILPKNAYESSNQHQQRPVLFESLFDVENVRVAYRFMEDNATTTSPDDCKRKIPWHPFRGASPAVDPFPNHTCIHLKCNWGYSHMVTPPDLFPHSDEVLFPYHARFREAAMRVLQQIEDRALRHQSTTRPNKMRLLSAQVRLGDRTTHPLVDCADFEDYPLVTTTMGENATKRYVLCASDTKQLTWPAFFRELSSNPSFPLYAKDHFDAVFLATNRPTLLRNEILNITNLFMIHDFDEIVSSILPADLRSVDSYPEDDPGSSVEVLVVEQLVMAMSDRYVPSFSSSITETVLRLGMAEMSDRQDLVRLQKMYRDYVTRYKAF